MLLYYLNVQSVSPGAVYTEQVVNLSKIIRDPETTVNFKFLNVEDVANAVISTLSTPPDVLVSIIFLFKCYKIINIFMQIV